MTPEGKVKFKLKARLKAEFPHLYQFMPVQSGLGATTLDLLYCIDGFFIAIETKAYRGGKMSPRQKEVAALIEQAGGLALLCDGVEEIESVVGAIHEHLTESARYHYWNLENNGGY